MWFDWCVHCNSRDTTLALITACGWTEDPGDFWSPCHLSVFPKFHEVRERVLSSQNTSSSRRRQRPLVKGFGKAAETTFIGNLRVEGTMVSWRSPINRELVQLWQQTNENKLVWFCYFFITEQEKKTSSVFTEFSYRLLHLLKQEC